MCVAGQREAGSKARPYRAQPVDLAMRARIAALSDATAIRREFVFSPPSFLRPILRAMLADPRDEPLLYLLLNVLLTTVPAAAAVYRLTAAASGPYPHLIGAAYLAVNYCTFLQRFLLGLHCAAHRPLFKPSWRALNGVMPYLVAPLFGIPAGMYQLHHCVMHHVVRHPFHPYLDTFSRAEGLGYRGSCLPHERLHLCLPGAQKPSDLTMSQGLGFYLHFVRFDRC